MNCPFCNKRIEGMTGLQEASKFQKHLGGCKKNPNSLSFVEKDGEIKLKSISLLDALTIRAQSGQ